jgi:hypothetical protein
MAAWLINSQCNSGLRTFAANESLNRVPGWQVTYVPDIAPSGAKDQNDHRFRAFLACPAHPSSILIKTISSS